MNKVISQALLKKKITSVRRFHHMGLFYLNNFTFRCNSSTFSLYLSDERRSEASLRHVKFSTAAPYRRTSVPYSVKCWRAGKSLLSLCYCVALMLPPLMFMPSRFLSLCVVQTSIKIFILQTCLSRQSTVK